MAQGRIVYNFLYEDELQYPIGELDVELETGNGLKYRQVPGPTLRVLQV